MAGVQNDAPPIFTAWLAQIGFVMLLFGLPILTISLFYPTSGRVIILVLFAYIAFYMYSFLFGMLYLKKSGYKWTSNIKKDWTDIYNWKDLETIIYYTLTFLTIPFPILYFSTNSSDSIYDILISTLSFVFLITPLLGSIGLFLAGIINGDLVKRARTT